MIRSTILTLLIMIGTAPNIFANDTRMKPIDVFILVDRSSAMAGAIGDAREWICANVVDLMLIPGDRIFLWTFSDATERLYNGETVSAELKESIKKSIRSVRGDDKEPNIQTALHSFLKEASSRADRSTIAYVLVAGSMIDDPLKDMANGKTANTEELLRFSRIEAMPGWKAVIVGINIEEKVRALAKEYLRETTTP